MNRFSSSDNAPDDGLTMLSEMERLSGLPLSSLPISGDDGFLAIDTTFAPDDLAALVSAKISKHRYPALHVETLLNQSLDLLERAARERSVYDSLREKSARLLIELVQEASEIELYDSQEETRIRELPIEMAQALQDAIGREIEFLKHSEKQLRESVPGHDPASSITKNTNYGGSSLEWHIHREIRGLSAKEFMDDCILLHGAVKEYPAVSVVSFLVGLRSVLSQLAATLAKLEQSNGAHKVAQQNVDLETLRRQTSNKRKQTTQNLLNLKLHLAKAERAFDFVSQMLSSRNRFASDFSDAVSRLTVVAEKVKELYGFGVSLPDFRADILIRNRTEDRAAFGSFNDEGMIAGGPFDRQLIWCRTASAFVLSTGLREQTYILPVSVSERLRSMGETKTLSDLINASSKTCEVRFPLESDLFSDQQAVRSRGLSASIIPRQDKQLLGSWSAVIEPPRTALYRSIGAESWQVFHQNFTKPVKVGRIRSSLRPEPADLVGIHSLHNVSPVSALSDSGDDGLWSLRLDRYSSQGEDLATIALDIELNLVLASHTL